MPEVRFSLIFTEGQWIAGTDNGDYDGAGSTVESAMADLINTLITALYTS